MGQKSIRVPSGSFLLLQGRPSSSFFILKSGKFEILINTDQPCPTEEEVSRGGKRVGIVADQNTPIGEIGVIEGVPRSASVRALEESSLIEVDGDRQEILKWLRTNHAAGLLIARTMTNRIVVSHIRWHRIRILSAAVRSRTENFAALYSILCKRIPQPGSAAEKFYKKGRELAAAHEKSSGKPFIDPDRNIPSTEIPVPLHLPVPELEQIHFISLLLARPDAELTWLGETQRLHPLGYASGVLAQTLPKISREVFEEFAKGEEALSNFYGPTGIIAVFGDLYPILTAEERTIADPYLKRLREIAANILENATELWGSEYPFMASANQNLAQLEEILMGKIPLPSEEEQKGAEASTNDAAPATPAFVAASAPSEPAANIVGIPLNFMEALTKLGLSPEETAKARLCMGLSDGTPREISAAYWSLYPRFWLANRDAMIPEITAFLRFGVASPKPCVLPEQLPLTDSRGPVMYLDEWIRRIHGEVSPPSRTELGLTLEEFLRTEKKTSYLDDGSPSSEQNVKFELEQAVSRAAAAFSGGKAASAYLTRNQAEIDDLAKRAVSPLKFAQAIVELLKIDFSAFYRDVRVVLEAKSEFLPKEVIPFAIIYPTEGDRGICWQEWEGRAKDTPARLFFPQLLREDPFDAVINVVARFRWIMNKTIVGSNWMNPTEGGLTGAYYDYSAYYKKNRELTDDQKDKLAEIYQSKPFDADKFAAEYAMWVKLESQGIQKLNKIARRIFATHCPFSIEVRKKLLGQPAFADVLYKDSNKRLKKKEEFERRIYKLERNGVAIGNYFVAALKLNEPLAEPK